MIQFYTIHKKECFSTQYIIIVGLLKLQYLLITEIMYAKENLCGYR
jgi:hypothetical protein